MKAIRLLLLSSFLVFMVLGCSTGAEEERENPDSENEGENQDNKEEGVIYSQQYSIRQSTSISLFESFYYLPDQDLYFVSKRKTIYDLEKTSQITNYIHYLRSSESYRVTGPLSGDSYSTSMGFLYWESKRFVTYFRDNDYSGYLNTAFTDAISRLEQGEITPLAIFEEYGTHVAFMVNEEVYFDFSLIIKSPTIALAEQNIISEFLTGYEDGRYSSDEVEQYNALSRKCDIDLNIKTNIKANSYLEILDVVNSNDFEPQLGIVVNPEGYVAIWDLLGAGHEAAKETLQQAYSDLPKA